MYEPGLFSWPLAATMRAIQPFIPSPGAEGVSCPSAVVLDNGHVLYCGVYLGNIVQGEAVNLTTFLKDPGSVPSVSTIFAGGQQPSCCVFRHPVTRVIYLVTHRGGLTMDGVANNWLVQIHRRTSGGSWVLHSTVHQQSFDGSGGNFANTGQQKMGMPYIEGSKWVVAGARAQHFSGNSWYARQPIWTSQDGGSTWTETYNPGYYLLGGAFGDSNARNLTVWQSKLWYATRGNVDPDKSAWSPDGTTWTEFSFPAVGFNANYCLADDFNIYTMQGGSAIYKATDPLNTATGYTLVENYALSGLPSEHGAILQKLGLVYVWMSRDKILVLRKKKVLPGVRIFQRDDGPRVSTTRNPPTGVDSSVRVLGQNTYQGRRVR